MKKANSTSDEMRAEYGREDLGPIVRGKYAARVKKSSNVVVIDDSLCDAFPNGEAVNAALRGLLAAAATISTPAKRAPRKRAPPNFSPIS